MLWCAAFLRREYSFLQWTGVLAVEGSKPSASSVVLGWRNCISQDSPQRLSLTKDWSIRSDKDTPIASSVAVPGRLFQTWNSLWEWLTPLLQMHPSVAERNVHLFSLLNPASFTSLQVLLLSFSQINHLYANMSVSWGPTLQKKKEKMWCSSFLKCAGLKATHITFTDNS